jgi:hypothetical protein
MWITGSSALGLNGPVLTATGEQPLRVRYAGLQSLTSKQRGRGPGSLHSALLRHIQSQGAVSIDLTNSV